MKLADIYKRPNCKPKLSNRSLQNNRDRDFLEHNVTIEHAHFNELLARNTQQEFLNPFGETLTAITLLNQYNTPLKIN